MKITNEKLEISPTKEVFWSEVEEIHLSGGRLLLLLAGKKRLEVTDLSPLLIDQIFRAYDSYLKSHANS